MKPRIIGLTGGIGSGKTTVAHFFEALGVPVYYADDRAKAVLETEKVSEEVRSYFGDVVFSSEGIDRKKLASVVFNDKEKLEVLNGIVHPAVGEDFREWLSEQTSDFIIREAAILFESGSYKDCDQIITVTAPVETRIERVMKRNGTSREEVLARMENQWSDAEKIIRSDYVIENEELAETERKVSEIYHSLKKM